MKWIIISIFIFSLQFGCATGTSQLITIKYSSEPFRTFEISKTDIKGIKLNNLTETLVKHKKNYPNAKYELLSEIKCVPGTEKEIKKAIKEAGINLEHYWAPVSFDTKEKSPHGPGYIDIMKDK